MSIRIILYELSESDEPIHETRRVHFSEKDQLLIGSNKNCDLVLSDIPDLAISIFKHNSNSYILEKKEQDVLLKIDNEENNKTSFQLKNGDKIQISKYVIQFIIEFSKASPHWNTGLVAYVSTFLIVSILVIEIGIMTWLPKEIKAKQLWGLEVTRQRTLDLMDRFRIRCESSVKTIDSRLEKNTLKLIIEELDDMSIYLRNYVNDLNSLQLTEINRDLSIYEDTVDRLEKGSLFPDKESVDAQFFFKQIIGD